MSRNFTKHQDSAFKRFGEHKSCRCRVDEYNNGTSHMVQCNYCTYACCKDCEVRNCVCSICLKACDKCAEEKKAKSFGADFIFNRRLCVGSHS